MDGIDEDFEDEVGLRAAYEESRNLLISSDGSVDKQYAPALAEAMNLSGGYVGYIRANAQKLLAEVVTDSEEFHVRCNRLGKFIAYMRARPSKVQAEIAEREFSARVTKQIVRLTSCLAAVLNRPSIDEEVIRRATKVTLDTSRGVTLTIVGHLSRSEHGLDTRSLAMYTNQRVDYIANMTRYLKRIGVLESIERVGPQGGKQQRWVMTPRLRRLYSEIEDI
jgi:hypothetical protein